MRNGIFTTMKFTTLIAPAIVPAVLLAAACAAPARPPASDVAGDITRAVTQPVETVEAVGRRYTVAAEDSDLRILVFPDGPLARFGHPHVIGGNVVSGSIWLAEDFHRSSVELSVDVPALRVDDPEWRLAEGFDPRMNDDAIAGTGDNLRSPDVLDAERYPEIVIRSVGVGGPRWQPDVTIEITVRGRTRTATVPVALDVAGGTLTATGRLLLRQTEFGIEPFSALSGRLRVADEIIVRFRVVARE